MRHNMQDFIKAGQVVYVAADGVARCGKAVAAAERARGAEMLSRAAPPVECGPRIPVAPARGPMITFTPREVVKTDAGNYRSVPTGHKGRKAARVADAFDNMTRDAIKAHMRLGGDDASFVPPFSVGQIEAGREYAALVERVASSGLGCASLEAAGRGGSGGEGVQAAVFRDIERLRFLRARIGNGLAKEVRRFRPDGDKRRVILARGLVDQVCVEGLSLEAVLKRHGWGINTRCREALRAALCSALDRMRGFDLVRPTK